MARKNNFGVAVAGGGDQSKRSENDFYGTPPEPTISLLQYYNDLIPDVVAELSCGQGHMAKVIAAHGRIVLSADKYHRGFGWGAVDFLTLPEIPAWRRMGLIMNPPFNLADDFITQAHRLGFPFIAMFLKQTYWNAAKRYELWKKYPPKAIHPIGWRVDFTGGGNATMDCCWTVFGDNVSHSNEPLRKAV